ncbi:hypothetical protein [Streptomyces sp. NPDC058665]|uniref:hypothetical protein n=1 Tax=Streptomyces sp. NPDC058665 TaxID=3346586 RepID=UPI003668F092
MPVAAVRGTVFSVASTVLAITGHHLATGQPVPGRSPWVVLGLLLPVTLPFSRRPRSLPTVMAATGAAQLALHFWLSRAPGRPAGSPHTMSGHTGSHDVHNAWHSGGHGVTMTAAHITAALLVAWCLQRADSACSFLGERLGEAIGSLVVLLIPAGTVLPAPRPPLPVAARAKSPPYDFLMLAYVVVRRGPPTKPALVS